MRRVNIRIKLTELCKDLGLQVGGTNKDRLDRIYEYLYNNKYHVLVDEKYQEGDEE